MSRSPRLSTQYVKCCFLTLTLLGFSLFANLSYAQSGAEAHNIAIPVLPDISSHLEHLLYKGDRIEVILPNLAIKKQFHYQAVCNFLAQTAWLDTLAVYPRPILLLTLSSGENFQIDYQIIEDQRKHQVLIIDLRTTVEVGPANQPIVEDSLHSWLTSATLPKEFDFRVDTDGCYAIIRLTKNLDNLDWMSWLSRQEIEAIRTAFISISRKLIDTRMKYQSKRI